MMLEQTLDRVVIRICFHNKFTAGVFQASEYQVPGLGGGGGALTLVLGTHCKTDLGSCGCECSLG